MEYLQKITLISAVLLLVLCLQTANAQSNIDANRMNRDLNIMENILQEMFKANWEGDDRIRVHAGFFSFGRDNDIRGTYLPGYGVIFTIPGISRGMTVINSSEGESFSYSFQYGDSENGEKVTQESITDRIVEFLRDYGSTIGQLSNNDKVLVIYNAHDQGPKIAFFASDKKKNVEQKALPTISVVAAKNDLQAYRAGNLNADEFRKRLDIGTAEANGKNQMDLKVMANIFETAFEESEKSFRISGGVNYLKLDNFGALFSFDARYSEGGWGAMAPVRHHLRVLRDDLSRTRFELKKELEDSTVLIKEFEEKQAQQKEEVQNAYDQFLKNLKEYLVDYGRTLGSIKSNQHILVSVSLADHYEDIPERIDLQIQKSTLEAMDKGNLSRNQAVKQIRVREY